MEGAQLKLQNIILDNTSFRHPCNIHKENKIPILKEYNIDPQCKESIKQILNMTKNPLSQHVDVLIPNLDRNDFEKVKLEYVKSFFGKKYITPNQQQLQPQKPLVTNATILKNPFKFETSISNFVRELFDTEEKHVSNLKEVVYKCMIPIKESFITKSPILDQYSFNRIFRNTDDLLATNQQFLNSLTQYKQDQTTETIGEIFLKHIDSFDCYKIYYLGQENAASCNKQNIKQNKNYSRFLLNTEFAGSLGLSDIFGEIIKRLGRYCLFIKDIIKNLDQNDPEIKILEYVLHKLHYLNSIHYGDSSLLNLYHLIKDAPASLIQTRQLLGYFDARELSLTSGKQSRPVTILVFSDKLMVVKRKNYHFEGKDILENVEGKSIDNKVSNNIFIQKAKEVYNGNSLEFKGWVDIKHVEIFNGLKDHPDTFFIKTNLPEISPDATEKECEEYFRRSNRLYSIIPSTTPNASFKTYLQNKQDLISLCQKQFALSKLKDNNDELFIEDKFKLPAFTHFYDQNSYRETKYKNNILIVYVEERCPIHEINLNSLVNNDVQIVILLTNHKSGGYKLTIRAKLSLFPIREFSRELEYENVTSTVKKDNSNGQLDFIDTLWNNIFFYERRLRATPAYSCVHDGLLRGRARSRSRSKSLTRVASNMSIGKLFTRSRSTSPSRPSSIELGQKEVESHVSDPVFKIATINKQVENSFRNSDASLLSSSSSTTDVTQPHNHSPNHLDSFEQDESAFYKRRSSSFSQFDNALFNNNVVSQSPVSISRPPSNGSHNSSSASSEPSDYVFRPSVSDQIYTTVSSYSSSTKSYYEDKYMDFITSRDKTNHSASYDEKLMNTIDNSRRMVNGSIRKAPLYSAFYSQQPHHQHQPQYTRTQIKNDVNQIIEEIIQSQQQLTSEDVSLHCIRSLRAIVSKIDECMDSSY